MYQKKLDDDYRTFLEYGLSRIGGKWEQRILCELTLHGRLRYSDLREYLEGVSETSLSLALRKMTEAGLLLRYQRNGRPMVVEYELDEKWRSAVMQLRGFCQFVQGCYGDEFGVPETCRLCMAANPRYE